MIEIPELDLDQLKRSISVLYSVAAANKRMKILFSISKINNIEAEILRELTHFLGGVNSVLSKFDKLVNVVLII